jgi:hypothetical protein
LDLGRLLIRWKLRDGAWIIENAPGRRKAAGALLEGDTRRAVEFVDGDPDAKRNAGTALATYVPVHYAAGDVKAVIAYYEAAMKTPAGAMAASNFCTCSPLQLVLALVEARAEGARRAAHAPPASAKINNPTARAAARCQCGRLFISANPRSSSVLAVHPALATLDVEQEKHGGEHEQNDLICLHS